MFIMGLSAEEGRRTAGLAHKNREKNGKSVVVRGTGRRGKLKSSCRNKENRNLIERRTVGSGKSTVLFLIHIKIQIEISEKIYIKEQMMCRTKGY